MTEHARRVSWTAADLLAAEMPEPRWAIDGLISEGFTFMAGAPKIGKSWLNLGLGISVASGGYALGKLPVDKGDTLYLALEDNARRLQSRLRLVLNGDAAPEHLYLELEWPRIREGCEDRLIAWLDAHPDARLVIADVWPRIRPRTNERHSFQDDYEAASALQAIAVSKGVAIVAIYHTRKAEADDFVETVQGTLGSAAAADTIIVVKRARGEADATLHITGRDVMEQEIALQFSPEAGTWSLLGDAAEYTLGKTRKKIVDVLHAHGSLKPKQVSELTDIEHELAKKTMQRMFGDGQLNANKGVYSLVLPVPGVPLSPRESDLGTEGREGHTSRGEHELELAPLDDWIPEGADGDFYDGIAA